MPRPRSLEVLEDQLKRELDHLSDLEETILYHARMLAEKRAAKQECSFHITDLQDTIKSLEGKTDAET